MELFAILRRTLMPRVPKDAFRIVASRERSYSKHLHDAAVLEHAAHTGDVSELGRVSLEILHMMAGGHAHRNMCIFARAMAATLGVMAVRHTKEVVDDYEDAAYFFLWPVVQLAFLLPPFESALLSAWLQTLVDPEQDPPHNRYGEDELAPYRLSACFTAIGAAHAGARGLAHKDAAADGAEILSRLQSPELREWIRALRLQIAISWADDLLPDLWRGLEASRNRIIRSGDRV